MKFFIKTCLLIFLPAVMLGQSLEDAKKLIYHENYSNAETMLHNLLKTEPTNTAAWYALTQAYTSQDKIKSLKDSLALAPEQVKNEPLIKSALAHVMLIENDSINAKQQFDAVLKDTKMKDPAVLAEIAGAIVNSKGGDANYALELLDKAIKRDKDNPALDVLMGDAYRKLIDGGNAYKSYMKALAKDPKYAAAEYKIGKIYTSQKNVTMYLPAFESAVAIDSVYAPALFELYYHYYYNNIAQAKNYLEKYIAASEYDISNDYLYADILYASGDFKEAVEKATALMQEEGSKTSPRLYKLTAYSYKEMGDTGRALGYMKTYFKEQHDTGVIAKDFEAMGDIYSSLNGKEDSAAFYYAKAVALETDNSVKSGYYKKIGGLYKKIKDYRNEAIWLGKYYASKPTASNVDLFNWGLASYLAKEYKNADTIFTMYEQKYPTEEFGFYWRARTNAAIDTAMEMGIAVPHYLDLITLLEKDSANTGAKKHLVEAYGYVAAYKANAQKDYESAITYFEKLLALDPDNGDAKRYVTILKKNLAKNGDGNASK